VGRYKPGNGKEPKDTPRELMRGFRVKEVMKSEAVCCFGCEEHMERLQKRVGLWEFVRWQREAFGAKEEIDGTYIFLFRFELVVTVRDQTSLMGIKLG
jgi:hypothetical protein